MNKVKAVAGSMRYYSFKAIKRPDHSSKSSKAYIDKKLKDFNMQQILRAKIEMSGPLTGKLTNTVAKCFLKLI